MTETETEGGRDRDIQRQEREREKGGGETETETGRQRETESAATAGSPGAVPLQSTYPTDDHDDSSQHQGQDLRQYVVTVPVLAGCYGDQSDHQQEGAQGLWNPGHGD